MHTSYHDISAMLAAAAPDLGVARIDAHEELQSWVISVDPDGQEGLTLDYDAASGRLVATVSLGPAPLEKQTAVYGFLLQYNAMWADTGGARAGLDGPDGSILLIADAPLEGLQQDSVAGLVNRAAVIARLLATGVSEGFENATTEAEDTASAGHFIVG